MPPADARLERHVDAAARSRAEDLGAVQREQRLVRGDDVLAGLDRAQDQPSRGVVAADQLHHHRDLGIGDQRLGIAVEAHAAEIDLVRARRVEIRDAHEPQRKAEALLDHRRVLAQHLDYARADRAEPDQSDADAPLRHVRPAHAPASRRNRRMPRTACRMRCLFSTSAKRT